MSNLLGFLSFISLIGLIVSAINPGIIFRKGNVSRKKAVGIFGVSLIVFFIAFGGSLPPEPKTSTKETPKTTTTQAPTTSKDTPIVTTNTVTPSQKPAETLTDSQRIQNSINEWAKDAKSVTVTDIDKNANSYNGVKLSFTCSIINFVKNNKGSVSGMNCSEPNNTMVYVQTSIDNFSFDLSKINTGDTVKIYGLGEGSGSGKNAFGATVYVGVVSTVFINDLTSGYME